MDIKIIKEKISQDELKRIAQESFGEMAKAVVDLEQEIIALGGELHADGEAMLLEQGSRQENIWGINIYPDKQRNEWIEYTSLINVRPTQGNKAMEIQNPEIKEKIKAIVDKLIG
ncbi:MAG: DUF5674 family protein [bacterium]|nr:DUF5674 family protein [bacterium]